MFVIDHALGDGVALVAALMSILDVPEKGASKVDPPSRRSAQPSAPLPARVCAAINGCLTAFGHLLCPSAFPTDSPSRLKFPDHRNPSPAKVCAQSDPVLLEDIKEIKDTFEGATVSHTRARIPHG